MVCKDVEQNGLAVKYLTRQLDPVTEDSFEGHILECASCQELVEALQAAQDDLKRRADKLRLYSHQTRSSLRWGWIGVAAALVVAIGLGIASLRKHFHSPVATGNKPQSPGLAQPGALHATDQPVPSPATQENQIGPGTAKPGGSALETWKTRATSAQKASLAREKQTGPSSYVSLRPTPEKSSAQQGSHDEAYASLPRRVVPVDALSKPGTTLGVRQPGLHENELAKLALVKPPRYTFSGAFHSTITGSAHPFRTPGNPSSSSGSLGMARSQFQNAMLAYTDGKYQEAEAQLDDAVKLAPGSAEINFYLGICEILDDKFENAILRLSAVSANENSSYAQAAHFYLAKAYLRLGDLSAAEEHFKAAAGMSGELTDEAKSTLKTLEVLRGNDQMGGHPSPPEKPKQQ